MAVIKSGLEGEDQPGGGGIKAIGRLRSAVDLGSVVRESSATTGFSESSRSELLAGSDRRGLESCTCRSGELG